MTEEKKHDEAVEKALAMFGRRVIDPPAVKAPIVPSPPARKPTGMDQLGVRRALWQIPIWERPTPRVDAILSEISRSRARGLEWDPVSRDWQPKGRQKAARRSWNTALAAGRDTEPESLTGQRFTVSPGYRREQGHIHTDAESREIADSGNGFDPDYPFPAESVDDFWNRIKAARTAKRLANEK